MATAITIPDDLQSFSLKFDTYYITYSDSNNNNKMNIRKNINVDNTFVFDFNKRCEIKHIKEDGMFYIYVNDKILIKCIYNGDDYYNVINDEIKDDDIYYSVDTMSAYMSILEDIVIDYDKLDNIF